MLAYLKRWIHREKRYSLLPFSRYLHSTDLPARFVNIGTTIGAPFYENERLFMHLTSDRQCNGTHNISTHIVFDCDPSTMLGQPDFLNEHGCTYNFVWPTSLACISTKPCVAVDPITRFTYDLSPLANRPYNVTTAAGLTYRFGVCNAAGAPCADGVGACRVNGTAAVAAVLPLGDFNAHMRFNQTGAPYLWYGSGAVCGNIRGQWSARVEFVCATAGMPEGPVVIEEDDECTVIVQFVTKLVCQQPIACKATDWLSDVEYDLGPLMSSTKNYVAEVDATVAAAVGKDKVVSLRWVGRKWIWCYLVYVFCVLVLVLFERVQAAGAAVWTELPRRIGCLCGDQYVDDADQGKGEFIEF